MKLRFLGTMDSAGIPVHNCDCVACQKYRESNTTNLATNAAIEYEDKVILLDAGTEDIATLYDGKKIEAILLTHFHADHTLGLLRLRHSKDKIICYHPKDEKGFADIFKHKKSIEYIANSPLKEIYIDNITIIPLPLIHSQNTTGYIIKTPNKTFAYLTDCAGIEDEYLEYLKKIEFDYIFIDACFIPPKIGNHLNYDQAHELLDMLTTKEAYLMHQSHENLTYRIQEKIELKYNYIDNDQEFII
jgi:phosphoribosyl 1,2-cyclic phosphate phosphodiesterase